MTFNWVPDPEILEEDRRHLLEKIQHLKWRIEGDHWANGRFHGMWITDRKYCEALPGIRDWVDQHDGMISWESFSLDLFISFKSLDDLLLFKLTWGGK